MAEETRIERTLIRRKKTRREFLKTAGQIVLGGTAASAVGTLIGRSVAEKGIKREEDLFPDAPLYKKEVNGQVKGFVFEEAYAQNDVLWPILRKNPNQKDIVGYVKPSTRALGVEVFGEEYSSNLEAGQTTDPRDPNHTYGIWVKLEDEVPLYDKNHNPKLDELGVQKTEKGFVSENFVTFVEEKEASSP